MRREGDWFNHARATRQIRFVVDVVRAFVMAFRGSRASRVYRITGNMNLEKGGKRMIDLEKRAKAWDEFSGEAREFTIGDTFNSAYELGVRDGAASVPKWTRVEDSQRAITIIDEILPFYTDARTDTRSWGVLRALETVRQRIMEGRGNDSGNNDDQTIRR